VVDVCLLQKAHPYKVSAVCGLGKLRERVSKVKGRKTFKKSKLKKPVYTVGNLRRLPPKILWGTRAAGRSGADAIANGDRALKLGFQWISGCGVRVMGARVLDSNSMAIQRAATACWTGLRVPQRAILRAVAAVVFHSRRRETGKICSGVVARPARQCKRSKRAAASKESESSKTMNHADCLSGAARS